MALSLHILPIWIHIVVLSKWMNNRWKFNGLVLLPKRLLMWILITLTVIQGTMFAIKVTLQVSVVVIKGDLRCSTHLKAATRVLLGLTKEHIELSVGAMRGAEYLPTNTIALHYLSASTAFMLVS